MIKKRYATLGSISLSFSKQRKQMSSMQIELLLECLDNRLSIEEIRSILSIDLSLENWFEYLSNVEKSNAINLGKYMNPIDVMVSVMKAKLHMMKRNTYINECFAYPVLLYFLSLNLLSFVGLSLIPMTFSSIESIDGGSVSGLLSLLQFVIGIEWGGLIILLIMVYKKEKIPAFKIYAHFHKRNTSNILTLWQSHTFVSNLHYLNKFSIPLHKSILVLKESKSSIQSSIANHAKSLLERGTALNSAFEYLDERFCYSLRFEDFERRIDDRLERYLGVLEKQIRYKLKYYANIFSAFVYCHIGFMVVLVYSVLLYPLKMLEQII